MTKFTKLSALVLSLSLSSSAFAVAQFDMGVQRQVVANGASLVQLHPRVRFDNAMSAGLGFGFASNFDNALIGGDFRYDFARKSNYGAFGQAQLAWAHQGAAGFTANGFVMGFLAGVYYDLTQQVELSVAYGLQLGFGDAFTDNNVAITNATNSNYVGNFAIHYKF